MVTCAIKILKSPDLGPMLYARAFVAKHFS